MAGPGWDGDDRTFRVNFAGDGAARLRERVKERLGEFMGSYTDDTLVEYVVVLLRNGRHKDEARRELNVFLGDDSLSFVSWLWDHLSSNLHLYVQPEESFPNKLVKTSPNNDLSGRHNTQPDHAIGDVHTDSEYERETSTRLSRSQRNREWKGLVHETELFPLRSTVADMYQSEEKTHGRPNLVRRSRSPILQINKKRARQDGQPMKRSTVSYPVIGAPRRLLQFAVRDAVRTVRQLSSRTEPDLKRLRSVDSLSATKSVLNERAKRMRSVARVSALSTALKAAAEAAKDELKVGYAGGVFDSLGHGMTTTDPDNQPSHNIAPVLEDGECEYFNKKRESNFVDYYQNSRFDGESMGDITMVGKDAGFTAYSALDSDRCDNVGIVRQRGMNISQSASSANKGRSSLKVQSSVAQDADEVIRKTRLMDQDASTSAAAKASSKIVNISVNVNTWKPPCYQAPRKVTEAENHMLDMNESSAGRPNVSLHKENDTAMAENENEISPSYVQKESQKTVASTSGSYITTRPSEDVESRIVFVSNVHFAAAKDTLSRHFNKFGEVLKVIILTDAATGQPKGSAYVEFLRKDSAELALSLNGTSFMSRILKVVRKSSVNHEAAPMFGGSRIALASAFAASRHARLAYPQGALGGAFRAHLQIKPGARSLQWKRGALTAQTSEGTKGLQIPSLASGNSMLSPVGRNLTYVRADSKANWISGPA